MVLVLVNWLRGAVQLDGLDDDHLSTIFGRIPTGIGADENVISLTVGVNPRSDLGNGVGLCCVGAV
jgi:hypothetical protein